MYIWCKHSAAEVHTNTRMGEKDAPVLLLDAARRMKVAGQICLRSVEHPFTVTGVSLGILPEGVSGAYNHVENIVFADGVPYPDKLSDMDTVSVKKNVTHVIWVRYDIEENAAPGLYRLPITVQTDVGELCATVTLQIYPVTLPLPGDLHTFGHEYFLNTFSCFPISGSLKHPPCEPFYSCTRYSPEWWDLMTEFAHTLKYLRVNSLNIGIMSLLADAGSKKLPEGGWQLNFDLFDAYVEHFMKHGSFRYLAVCAIIASVNGKRIQCLNENSEVEWLELSHPEAELWAAAFYGGVYRHFEEKGWLDMLVMRLQDEPHAKDDWLWAREKCRVYMPGIPCGEPIDTHAVGRELADACDQYIPRLEVYDEGADFYIERQKKGDTVWCYSCCLPEEPWWLNKFIDLPHRYSRLIKWACYSQGITGFLHWGFNYWGGELYGLSPEARFKGDGFVVYPNVASNGLYLSARAIATCDGIQEWELLRMLAAYDPQGAIQLAKRVARTFRDYDTNENTVDEARRALLTLLSAYTVS